MPKTRVEFWTSKIEWNRERDVESIEKLQRLGWDVVLIWECQLTEKRRRATLNGLLDVLYGNLVVHVKNEADVGIEKESVVVDGSLAPSASKACTNGKGGFG